MLQEHVQELGSRLILRGGASGAGEGRGTVKLVGGFDFLGQAIRVH